MVGSEVCVDLKIMKTYKRGLDSLMSSIHRLETGNDYSIEREYTDNGKRQVTDAKRIGKMVEEFANVWRTYPWT